MGASSLSFSECELLTVNNNCPVLLWCFCVRILALFLSLSVLSLSLIFHVCYSPCYSSCYSSHSLPVFLLSFVLFSVLNSTLLFTSLFLFRSLSQHQLYRGPAMQYRVLYNCPTDCSEHGACDNGTCICRDGFTGVACEFAIPAEHSSNSWEVIVIAIGSLCFLLVIGLSILLVLKLREAAKFRNENKAVQAANKAKSQFLRTMSHEVSHCGFWFVFTRVATFDCCVITANFSSSLENKCSLIVWRVCCHIKDEVYVCHLLWHCFPDKCSVQHAFWCWYSTTNNA